MTAHVDSILLHYKFPIFIFDHKNPLYIVDKIIAKVFAVRDQDNIACLQNVINETLTQRQLMFHLERLTENKILSKEQLSERKAIYRINKKTLENKDILFDVQFDAKVVTLFPYLIHALPFFNPHKQILNQRDFLHDIVTDIQSSSLSNWFPSNQRLFEFAIFFSAPKGVVNTVKDLQIITVVHSLVYQLFKVKLFLEREYGYTFSDEELMSARIKIGTIVKYFNNKHSIHYVERVLESLETIKQLAFRLSKKVGDKQKAKSFKPYSLGYNNNYTLLDSSVVENDNRDSVTTYVDVQLPKYYANYFRWLYEEEKDFNVQSIPYTDVFLKNETQCKMKIMLVNLSLLSANCVVKFREFIRLVLCKTQMQRYSSKTFKNKIINDFITVMKTCDNFKEVRSDDYAEMYTCEILNKRKMLFNRKTFDLAFSIID